MITYPDVEDLLDFRSKGQPIVSFYLNTDRSRYSLDQQRVTCRNLLREGRRNMESGPWSESAKAHLSEDLNRVEKFLDQVLEPTFSPRGLTIFACHEAGLWRVFHLPRPVPSGLMLELTPHIRPLTLILDEYHRFGVLILDRRAAELHEVYIGEIIKLEEAFAATTHAVLLSTAVEHPGSADRGISTHRSDEEMQKHFRRVADITFHQFHRRHYEYLVLGGQQPLLVQFENFLHPSLQERLVGRFPAEPGKARPAKILEEVSSIERKVEIETEKLLVRQLIDSAKSRGLALLGLDKVLSALRVGAVHMLFVEDGWHKPGVLCRNCGFLGLQGNNCPGCGSQIDQVHDVVDDVIESALKTGSIIEHVNPMAGLGDQGHIGAILRFKPQAV